MSHCCGGHKDESVVLDVKGMSCNHCVVSIKNGLGEIEGIKNVEVNLEQGKVSVEFDSHKVDIEKIKETISDIGYDVV